MASDRVPVWLWMTTLALLGVVIFLQRPPSVSRQELAELESGIHIDRPAVSEFVLIGKLLIAIKTFTGVQDPMVLSQVVQQSDTIAEQTRAAQDRFRAAIVAGEADGFGAIKERFEKLLPLLAPESPLRTDIQTVTDAFVHPDPDQDLASTPEADALIERHGWIGQLAIDQAQAAAGALVPGTSSVPKPPDEFRERAAFEGGVTLFVLVIFGFLALCAFLAGMVLHIIGWVRFATGRLRPFGASAADGSPRIRHAAIEAPPIPARIWVETFAIFLFGFLLLKLVATLVAVLAPGAAWPEWFHLVAQWAIAPLILWPAVRIKSWDRVRFEIGWHRGRGVAREVLAGIGGYLAMLPVLVAVAIIAMIINNLLGNQSTPTRDNPVLSRATGGFVELLLLGTLVAIWAPLVEESLFRGVVFRFFRRRWGVLAGAGGSALLFAGLHSYVLQGLVIVGTLGFWFALVREWRGSLIPSMTAHCLHNSVAFILITIIAHIARG